MFIPLTNCSLAQYAKTRFFKDVSIVYALISAGGILLHNRKIDTNWLYETLELIEPSLYELWKSKKILEKDPNRCAIVKSLNDMMMHTKSSNPNETLNRLKESLDPSKITIKHINEKIYIIPNELNKVKTLQRLQKLMPNETFYITSCSNSKDLNNIYQKYNMKENTN